MNTNLFEVEQRVQRYWFTDGIAELTGGGMFILLGIYFAAQQYLGETSLAGGLMQAGLILFLIGGMTAGRRLIHSLKARLTYPRTGYVEYHVDQRNLNRRRLIVGIVAAFVAAFSVIFAAQFPAFLNITLVLTGVLVGIILIFMRGKRSGLERFYILGALSMSLGIVLALSSVPVGYGLGLFYALMGLAFAASGGLVLRRYLAANPLPAEAENE